MQVDITISGVVAGTLKPYVLKFSETITGIGGLLQSPTEEQITNQIKKVVKAALAVPEIQ